MCNMMSLFFPLNGNFLTAVPQLKTLDDCFGRLRSTGIDAYFPLWTRLAFR